MLSVKGPQVCTICYEERESFVKAPCGHSECSDCKISWVEEKFKTEVARACNEGYLPGYRILDPLFTRPKTDCPFCKHICSVDELTDPGGLPFFSPRRVQRIEMVRHVLVAAIIDVVLCLRVNFPRVEDQTFHKFQKQEVILRIAKLCLVLEGVLHPTSPIEDRKEVTIQESFGSLPAKETQRFVHISQVTIGEKHILNVLISGVAIIFASKILHIKRARLITHFLAVYFFKMSISEKNDYKRLELIEVFIISSVFGMMYLPLKTTLMTSLFLVAHKTMEFYLYKISPQEENAAISP